MFKYIRLSVNSRWYSTKHATKPPAKYTETINLPKTKFPNRLSAAKRKEIEQRILQSSFAEAYDHQWAHNEEPTFVLHDGPPYANGDLHMGHAVNKILKDICLRSNVAKGRKVNYIPGWDCHGLPIELKATAGGKGSPLEIREKSRKFALEAVSRQKHEFESWGVLAKWHNNENIYLTIEPDFITRQLKLFHEFFTKGLVYRDLKPVYWSPSSKTALAEAELEYDEFFISPSVYVRFTLTNLADSLKNINVPVYALVWTTTPWTLPSNQAICYNSSLEYAVVRLGEGEELYILASNLISDFENVTKTSCKIEATIRGNELGNCTYKHPIDAAQQAVKFLEAPHVQDNKGTGLVHTAPAHGPEDFLVSLKYKMSLISYVNEEGIFSPESPQFLRGKSVLEDGDRLVLEEIAHDIVFAGKLTHSYPIDWRTKKPVIIRASEQWFMNTDQLKSRALEELNHIDIYPRIHAEASKKALETQVRKRPYWCISRQRVWGVPIPVFYRKTNGDIIISKGIVEHICALVEKHGNIDFWWSNRIEDILPEGLLKEFGLGYDDIVRGRDIFDIWFDSGSTWASVLSDLNKADLYLEGYDQFTGWFQSSLLISIAARNCAPYKSLFVHGFTVDEKGYKMSKSLGNVIAPQQITEKYGVDTLRWWIASHATQNMSITVSDKLLQQSAESLSKVRSILRYLNGAIGDASQSVDDLTFTSDTSFLNRYLLSNLVDFDNEIQRSYDDYEFNRVVAQIQYFVVNQISAVYIHSIKDRLYCGNPGELANIRHTLLQCYKILCKSLWPLTPFLVEESWNHYDPNSCFHQQAVKTTATWKNDEVEQVIGTALNVKRLINQASGGANTWTLAAEVGGSQATLLQNMQPKLNEFCTESELCEVLQLNRIKIMPSAAALDSPSSDEILVRVEPISDIALCPRCRRFSTESGDTTCKRCTGVLQMKK